MQGEDGFAFFAQAWLNCLKSDSALILVEHDLYGAG
jgi:hypothetical protein